MAGGQNDRDGWIDRAYFAGQHITAAIRQTDIENDGGNVAIGRLKFVERFGRGIGSFRDESGILQILHGKHLDQNLIFDDKNAQPGPPELQPTPDHPAEMIPARRAADYWDLPVSGFARQVSLSD
jgi:hypothetical protein